MSPVRRTGRWAGRSSRCRRAAGRSRGLGEKFSPDLFTGTGQLLGADCAARRAGRGWQPQLRLVYSTGNGNGAFGLGLGAERPGRDPQDLARASRGTPTPAGASRRLRAVRGGGPGPGRRRRDRGRVRYRPRTEGLFARIEHVTATTPSDFWEVRTRDGLTHPLRHARGQPVWPRLAGPGRGRRPGRSGAGVRLADHRDPRPARQPDPLRLPRATQGQEPGAPVAPAAARADPLRRLRRPRRHRRSSSRSTSTTSRAPDAFSDYRRRVRGPHLAAVSRVPGEHPRRRRSHPGRPRVPARPTSRRAFNGMSLLHPGRRGRHR